ncbi:MULTISPECIES: outer membrane protein assembly factor BamE [Legionella]|uniref:Outer membrane protein assembly factor BamE n=1 Tax=Legionella septentrionalis TaxID=2498109 RepID=A0A433JIT4_9GAMM|nr:MULTISPECIES: outer membrane protein assembly factor BamE [Legionella]MCP0913856.1 outer membrane protein assembly factor BamE [Legionella sp. 27cVA30]RUQ85276.1 outer membrane protein assembly factor BamE [Legionella septentrionalis]RUQ98700.1 outer membrane protein assembly factor BamE [Legionella septentrionalis]RUR09928.1 outer membrane protein assembly factor BamE [Legionella septentrionalis]RUR14993.1 outer membrane protein assembly factor BamE [Legionella septentrionalis]
MRIKTILISVAFVLTLPSCASYDFSRRAVQQGNLLPQSKIERLHVGMSKEDVAILMGTSLISPLFTQDRWDYAYTWRRGNGPMQQRNLVLYFRHGQLVRIQHNP